LHFLLWKSVTFKIYGFLNPARLPEKKFNLLVYQLLELLISESPLGRILPSYQL